MSKFLYAVLFTCAVLSCHAQPSKTASRGEAEYYVEAYARHYGVPVGFVRAIVDQEFWLESLRHFAQGRCGSISIISSTRKRLAYQRNPTLTAWSKSSCRSARASPHDGYRCPKECCC